MDFVNLQGFFCKFTKLFARFLVLANEASPSFHELNGWDRQYWAAEITNPCCHVAFWTTNDRVVILSIQRPFGRQTGRASRQPCPLCLTWTDRGTIDREIIVPNLLYCSNFSYYFLPIWSRAGWQFEVAAHRSVPAPVWPFKFTMGNQSMPIWSLSGGTKVYRA